MVVALLVLLWLLTSAAYFDMDLVRRNKHVVCVFLIVSKSRSLFFESIAKKFYTAHMYSWFSNMKCELRYEWYK